MANISGAASLLFFGLTVILMFSLVERNLVLFVMAVLYCVETLLFLKYYVDIIFLFRMKFRWHANRVWVPLADLCVVTVASAVAFNLLELQSDSSDPLSEQLFQATEQQTFAVIAVGLGLLFKLIGAVLLTLVHVRSIKQHPTKPSYVNLRTWPYNATAPEFDDIL
jgi:hypothetical protein